MKNSQKIKLAIIHAKISAAKLARRLFISQSAFCQRLKTDKFSKDELENIAAELGAEYISKIVFPDGTEF
ncbi:MAG: XRE family transcriptional regulator [Clostridiales bacterium]|nr:XRE family transcriptional regulator [Clostridiales bacterium]